MYAEQFDHSNLRHKKHSIASTMPFACLNIYGGVLRSLQISMDVNELMPICLRQSVSNQVLRIVIYYGDLDSSQYFPLRNASGFK